MSWSALCDHTHILKGVPVDADIELQCKTCKTYFYTINAYYIGYSEIFYSNPEEQGQCEHDLKKLSPTRVSGHNENLLFWPEWLLKTSLTISDNIKTLQKSGQEGP